MAGCFLRERFTRGTRSQSLRLSRGHQSSAFVVGRVSFRLIYWCFREDLIETFDHLLDEGF